MTATVPRSRLAEALAYVAWFYTPFRRMSARDIYELVSTRSFSNRGLYLNLGYWKEARTIDAACEAMAMLVAEEAGVGPADEVLDVGFGFADQDMLWMERLAPKRIVGLNITPSQVRLGRQRVAERGMADRIFLVEASATRMPLADASADAVLGVECAFHFDTREQFLAEAFRVLRPGGRLVLADVIMAEPTGSAFQRRMQRFNWTFFAQKYAVPEANFDTRPMLAAKLGDAGFTGAEVRSISTEVYPGLHRYMAEDPQMLDRFHPLARMPYRMTLRYPWQKVYSAYDYVLAKARKPG